ncbi:MAG: FkbM family methyltransferase [Parachlamydiaceae bacterium]
MLSKNIVNHFKHYTFAVTLMTCVFLTHSQTIASSDESISGDPMLRECVSGKFNKPKRTPQKDDWKKTKEDKKKRFREDKKKNRFDNNKLRVPEPKVIKSYARGDFQNVPLDLKLIEKLVPTNKIFIEVGANDGLNQSNTKLLEESYGWTGILIEPSTVLYEKLCGNRPNSQCFNCALGSFEDHNTLMYGDFDGNLMSSINGTRLGREAENVTQVRSLQSILDEVDVQHINFFSLDTEGYEFNILKGIDFNKTTFDYLLIETYSHNHQEIIDLLSSHGYEMVECFSNYSKETNPEWDGLHNDYLFRAKQNDLPDSVDVQENSKKWGFDHLFGQKFTR